MAKIDWGQCVCRLSDKGQRCSRLFSNKLLWQYSLFAPAQILAVAVYYGRTLQLLKYKFWQWQYGSMVVCFIVVTFDCWRKQIWQLQYGSMVISIMVVPLNCSRINFGSCAMVLIMAGPFICSSRILAVTVW